MKQFWKRFQQPITWFTTFIGFIVLCGSIGIEDANTSFVSAAVGLTMFMLGFALQNPYE